MSVLAINGGEKVRTELFEPYNLMGQEEKDAVNKVMDTGVLSKFIGAWEDDFYGGSEIQAFEREWSEEFGIKHTVSVNSNSSGLHVALGACGIGYGDEVIVSPYSMSVSATAPLVWNATPVFADISPNHYNIDIDSIKKNITEKTKAIIVVHIMGCPADMDEIMKIAKTYNLFVIEDAAQAPYSMYKDQRAGTIGDIGVYSLNYHKHIHTGEGGMCVTNNKVLFEKMQMIRNHAESIVEAKGEIDLVNMLGFNFRLTEIQAAIGRVQIKKLRSEVKIRQQYAEIFNKALNKYEFIDITKLEDRTHSYYVQAFQFHEEKVGVSREIFLAAVRAELQPVRTREDEGVPVYGGYVKPLHLIPMFQKRKVYSNGSFPFNKNVSYDRGICPVVEDMHDKKLWTHDFVKSSLKEEDVFDLVKAYQKVCDNINELK
ncbi:DegT/DnrJ/EryC1/StrS family aminotransferase [Sulfurimonas sp.]|uniref:DegT/DnrJ/EryC1/StrS family aminotransferase n=1 Tax=Sulfurimonas sp. TaxID=2022749 RepID=UPI002AB00BB6|nr:DegT/DnrJ/EryC1/StrS family aminotransferase [Sulfurimonas sp.]